MGMTDQRVEEIHRVIKSASSRMLLQVSWWMARSDQLASLVDDEIKSRGI